MVLLAPFVITLVIGQRFPLFEIDIVKATGSGVWITVLAVAPQRMQRQMQRAQYRLQGDDRFGWKVAKRGKQSFA
ncbi:hypothetical protein XAXN_05635 [Xanthomonas axonopodis]|uniref:Uncharacterized protein n=1 Tax=Xanthomonas axonopodis TaxID=53413 RepID=A0A0P6VBR1_9XANT|nr:hypothetical protein XAXN_05635 [Xanthomonas axonopodis]